LKSDELQWPSQLPWGGQSGKLTGKLKCRLRTCVDDLRTGKGLRLVVGFMLKVRVISKS